MAEKINNSYVLIAIVAIVAVVGLITVFSGRNIPSANYVGQAGKAIEVAQSAENIARFESFHSEREYVFGLLATCPDALEVLEDANSFTIRKDLRRELTACGLEEDIPRILAFFEEMDYIFTHLSSEYRQWVIEQNPELEFEVLAKIPDSEIEKINCMIFCSHNNAIPNCMDYCMYGASFGC